MKSRTESIHLLFRKVRQDPQYAGLEREYAAMEERIAGLIQSLPEGEQDLIWRFVCTSDAMNWRMIEYICEEYGIN